MSSSPPPSLRRRGGKKDVNAYVSPSNATAAPVSAQGPEWDYKIAMAVLTALGFLTRFWNIGYPNEVVFDEVHFGKVWHFS